MSGDQLRERELREIAECALCRKPFGATGLPLFWRVRLTRYGVNLAAVQRQSGLAMALGSPGLAQVMGPDEPMATAIVPPVEITVCETCASADRSVYALHAAAEPEG